MTINMTVRLRMKDNWHLIPWRHELNCTDMHTTYDRQQLMAELIFTFTHCHSQSIHMFTWKTRRSCAGVGWRCASQRPEVEVGEPKWMFAFHYWLKAVGRRVLIDWLFNHCHGAASQQKSAVNNRPMRDMFSCLRRCMASHLKCSY